MSIHNLFPLPVGHYVINRDLTETEMDFCRNQKTYSNIGNLTSENVRILFSDELTDIRLFIQSKLSEYFYGVVAPKEDTKIQLTQSWINYNYPGMFHQMHTHPNAFISGVFYIEANQKTDKIYFYNKHIPQIRIVPKNSNIWNSESWWVSIGTGDLIIFPSYFPHSVETKKGGERRISLAFNAFPVGNLGGEFELTHLNILGVS